MGYPELLRVGDTNIEKARRNVGLFIGFWNETVKVLLSV